MKEIMKTIGKRRSIRKFKEEMISDVFIKEILYAATLAPSAHNKQPWEFVVIKNKLLKDKIANFLLEDDQKREVISSSSNTARIMKEAPVLILIYNKYNEHPLFNHLSLGAAIQNILLAATAHDIGSLWIGNLVKVEKEVETLLLKNKQLVSAVALGMADEMPIMPERNLVDAITDWRE